jgi:hypothetical protein
MRLATWTDQHGIVGLDHNEIVYTDQADDAAGGCIDKTVR